MDKRLVTYFDEISKDARSCIYLIDFKITSPLTKNNIIDLCNELSNDEFTFKPENVHGSIVIDKWTNKTTDQYKAIKFTVESWTTSWDDNLNEVIVNPLKSPRQIMLKSFHNSPLWSVQELTRICQVLTNHNFKLYRHGKLMKFI